MTAHDVDQQPVFMRQDVDASAADENELAARREKLAQRMQQIGQLTAWLESAPPLVEWG